MLEVWAYCNPCGRWFYPEMPSEDGEGRPTCPVCATDATTLAERPEKTA